MFKFEWDEGTLRYRDKVSGRFVSEDDVRSGVQSVIDASKQRMDRWSSDLVSGAMPLRDWQSNMANEVRRVHAISAMAAAGGKKRVELARPGYADAEVRKQLGFLNRFAQDIAARKQPLTGQVAARAKLYAQAGMNTHENQKRRNWDGRVFTQERWELSQAEHCSGCIAQAGRGWVPKGTLPPIGSQQCRTHCRCHIKTRRDPFSQNPCALEPIAAAARR